MKIKINPMLLRMIKKFQRKKFLKKIILIIKFHIKTKKLKMNCLKKRKNKNSPQILMKKVYNNYNQMIMLRINLKLMINKNKMKTFLNIKMKRKIPTPFQNK